MYNIYVCMSVCVYRASLFKEVVCYCDARIKTKLRYEDLLAFDNSIFLPAWDVLPPPNQIYSSSLSVVQNVKYSIDIQNKS